MTRTATLLLLLAGCAGTCVAEEDAAAPREATPSAAVPKLRLDGAPPIRRIDPVQADAAAGDGKDAPRFSSAAQWAIAGYNDEEIVFTIVLSSQDTRIIRCTTRIKGYYFENGQKLSVEDQQVTTVFPDQQAQVGNWLGMDPQSGATYSVRCKPL